MLLWLRLLMILHWRWSGLKLGSFKELVVVGVAIVDVVKVIAVAVEVVAVVVKESLRSWTNLKDGKVLNTNQLQTCLLLTCCCMLTLLAKNIGCGGANG